MITGQRYSGVEFKAFMSDKRWRAVLLQEKRNLERDGRKVYTCYVCLKL